MKTKLAITGIILALAAGLTPAAQAAEPKTLVIILLQARHLGVFVSSFIPCVTVQVASQSGHLYS
jgi:hypothetical protein